MHAHDGMTMQRSLWKTPAVVTALVLLIPLFGNSFVDGWNWKPQGFALAGVLVFGFALAYELVTRNMDAIAYRAAVAVALVATFILAWMNVVQFVDAVNRAAPLFFFVPIVGFVGATIARFRPAGMARALFATAITQALMLTIALLIRNQVTTSPDGVLRGFGLNAFLLMLFIGSAFLFRAAAHRSVQ